MQGSHDHVDSAEGSVGLKDSTRPGYALPTKERPVFEDNHVHMQHTTPSSTLRPPVTPTNMYRRQSWSVLTNEYASMRLETAPSSVSAMTSSILSNSAQQTQPRGKRRADGSLKNEQIWQMEALKDGLLRQESGGRASEARIHMEMDVLMRRIAVIQARERVQELRRSRNPPLRQIPSHATRIQEIRKRKHQRIVAEPRIMDWEPVLR